MFVMCGYRKAIKKYYKIINNIRSKTFNSKIGNIEYLLTGKGPTILISHGISGGIDQGMLLANNFISKNNRLLFISRFGYLNSAMPKNPSAELQADAYKELIDHLGIKKIILYANSAGSTSVLHFAIKYPKNCCGLILQAPNAPLDYNPGAPPKFVFKNNFLYWFFMKLFGKMMASMFVSKEILKNLTREERTELMDEVFFSALPVSERTKGIIFDAYISNPSINEMNSLNLISTPTLILNTIDDPATVISGARKLTEKITNSKLVEFDSGSHIFYGQQDKVKSETKKFIDKHKGTC